MNETFSAAAAVADDFRGSMFLCAAFIGAFGAVVLFSDHRQTPEWRYQKPSAFRIKFVICAFLVALSICAIFAHASTYGRFISVAANQREIVLRYANLFSDEATKTIQAGRVKYVFFGHVGKRGDMCHIVLDLGNGESYKSQSVYRRDAGACRQSREQFLSAIKRGS